MATGVPVSPDCLKAYQEIKLGKKIKYIIFSLNPTSTEIIVVKKSPDTDYETFLKDLPETEPRWAVYDFQYEAEGGGQRNKLVFISWVPDNAKIKLKMVHAGSKDTLRKALDGIAAEVQATDYDEVDFNTVLAKAKQGSR